MSRDQLQAMIDRVVDDLPELSEEQCRRVALVLHTSGAFM
ncbi:hypothetical protein J2X12_002835 [Pseudarthrobacter oxydans]|uniref:Uncharacterized protein n=1 Tax=Pseudarthrobacter oxydans TaxID=1671 RepID=A0AAW8NB05_PSEOX|nr:hypothetical protein [Pseudarthrobacter oxydans]MDR7164797.1 hypothetical protein [Pseudarthrobacter oxydans]